MNSSKIIRHNDAQNCQSVVMTELNEVVESQVGSFVVLNPGTLSHVTQPEDDGPKITAGGSAPPEKQTADVASAEYEDALRTEFERGRQSGIEEVESQLSKATQALASACSEIAGLKDGMLQRSSDDMLRLVLAITERVIQGELSINEEVIARTVQQAIQVAVDAEEFRIKVNPADLDVVQERKPLFVASLSGLSNIEFVADPDIARGGCVLESPLGRVDATIEAQLEAITATLQQAIGAS